MPYVSFEDMDVWKRASDLTVNVYRQLKECRDYGLRDQMTRAAVSIPSNIAEGAERNSNLEFARFVNIAKGSAAELRTQLMIASRVGVLEPKTAAELVEETRAMSAMLHRLATSLKRNLNR
jgi:four helix bundle protein